VEHFENRLAAMDGKAMIVCMSRRIAVELYNEIAALRPAWGASRRRFRAHQGRHDRLGFGSRSTGRCIIRNKPRREDLAKRFRDRTIPSGSFSCATCGSPASTRQPAHDVRRQADARAWADAGDRARQPRVQATSPAGWWSTTSAWPTS
jgi:hypothetical protein